jgi:quinol monooxygenase YgiN
MAEQSPVRVGLLVRFEAKTGHEEEVENFVRGALEMVHDEPATLAWFGMRLGPSTFGIFDAFPDAAGRQAHLEGKVAAALTDKADTLLTGAPTIEHVDLLAVKLPALVATSS